MDGVNQRPASLNSWFEERNKLTSFICFWTGSFCICLDLWRGLDGVVCASGFLYCGWRWVTSMKVLMIVSAGHSPTSSPFHSDQGRSNSSTQQHQLVLQTWRNQLI